MGRSIGEDGHRSIVERLREKGKKTEARETEKTMTEKCRLVVRARWLLSFTALFPQPSGPRCLEAVQQITGERVYEWPAPEADGQRGAEEKHGTHAGDTFRGPVNVGEIEPESELVEGECRADGVEKCSHASCPEGTPVHAGADLREPKIADDQQQQNAEDQVMDVASAAGFDVVKWAPPGADGVRNNANDGEGQEESCGRDEVALAPAFSKVPAIVMRQASEGA